MIFDFNTLKDNTFCIYDVKEGQVDKISHILEDLGMKMSVAYSPIYYFSNGYKFGKYQGCQKCYFTHNRMNTHEDYRKTATEFLEEYAQWLSAGTAENYYTRFLGKKYAVHCKTQKEWDRVQPKTGEDKYDEWDTYRGETCIACDDGAFTDKDYMINSEGYTILSVAEFFGEEEAKDYSKETYEECVKRYEDYSYLPFSRGLGKGIIEELTNYNKPNKLKKTMSNIVKFAKDMTLSSDEKALRKAGLKDSDTGNWTMTARDLVIQKGVEKKGYKSIEKMAAKLGCNEYVVSIFEIYEFFEEFKAELLDTAKKYNADQKKK